MSAYDYMIVGYPDHESKTANANAKMKRVVAREEDMGCRPDLPDAEVRGIRRKDL